MADRIEKDIQRFVQGVEQLISRRLPIYAGKTAQQHFRENFTKGDFVDRGCTRLATYFYWHQRSWPQNKKKTTTFRGCRLVNSLGLEPRTPTLKVLCSTC